MLGTSLRSSGNTSVCQSPNTLPSAGAYLPCYTEKENTPPTKNPTHGSSSTAARKINERQVVQMNGKEFLGDFCELHRQTSEWINRIKNDMCEFYSLSIFRSSVWRSDTMPRMMLLVVEQSWRGRFISTSPVLWPRGRHAILGRVPKSTCSVGGAVASSFPCTSLSHVFLIRSLQMLIDKKSCPGAVVKFM